MNTEHTKYYNTEGTEIPSVTTILRVLAKPALIAWANRQGQKGQTVEQAISYSTEVGQMLHHRINCYASGTEPEFNSFCSARAIKKSAQLFQSFLCYLESRAGTIVNSELRLVSTDQQFGGTIDLIVNTNTGLEVWDIKTSIDIWPEQKIQVCAYELLHFQHYRQRARPRIVLLPKAGKLYAPDITEDCEFLCKKIWHLLVPLWYAREELENLL